VKLRMRDGYVCVRVVKGGQVGKIHLPERADEGRSFFVHALAQGITDLKEGDRVVLFADNDTMFFNVPGSKDLVIIKAEYVSAVVEEETNP
jgi:hypothetical protein